jgi:hypothetical protein
VRYFNQGRFRQQVEFLRSQFLQEGELPLSNVLSEEVVAEALAAISTCWLDRIYSPLVTLWVFLSQVFECGPFVSRCGRAVDRPPDFAGAMSVLWGDRCLLPSQEASTRRVFLGRGSPNRAGIGNQR